MSSVEEHQIKLVPVEYLQRDDDESEDEDDSDIESVSSDEEVKELPTVVVSHIPQQHAPAIKPTITGHENGDIDVSSKQVNCLFCFGKVTKFNIKKPFHRRILNNTCHRLFKYICNHLDIEPPKVPGGGRSLHKPPRESLLLPAYLPLCSRCRELYYNNIYDTFVTYEAAVLKLSDQIAACVTRSIGISANRNKNSMGGTTGGAEDDIFDAYEKSMNEHEVMHAVREFRQKVVEKNPAGYTEESRSHGGRAGRSRSKNIPEPSKTEASSSAAASSSGTEDKKVKVANDSSEEEDDESSQTIRTSNLKNVIKIVKNRSDFLHQKKTPSEMVSDRLDAVKRDMDNENDGIEVVEEIGSSKTDLNYYAVSNPEPGVIKIIPIVVGDKGETIPAVPGTSKKQKKRKRSDREDFQKQRIALNTCKFCNKYFAGTNLLIKHQVHQHGLEKPEKCPKCDYRGISKASLKSHMNTHLDGEDKERAKKFRCHICSLKFNAKNGLNNHLRTHTGEKPFICEVCGKMFTSNTSRQLCLDKHNGVKHHKCPFCDKTFLRREVLKIHERTHTGEKPFVCHICGKAFAQRSPLNIHLKMHKRKDPSTYVPKPRQR